MPNAVIETSGLKKSYKDAVVVNGINLSVERGSIYGYLGRNGSGKTTTIKMLMGLTYPTSGEARVFGLRPDDRQEGVRIRERVGFVGEGRGLYDHLKVGQMIEFTRSFFPKWDQALAERLLKSFDLSLKQSIRTLSKGVRARLALLLAFSRRAELLILDEPTEGLDPEATESVRIDKPDKPSSWWNPLRVMAGSSYFYQGEIPWIGLLVSLSLAAVFLFTTVRIFERRDF